MHRDLTTDSRWEANMHGRKVTVLTSLAGVLALGEFGSAVIIWLEKYPDSLPAAVVVFGLFFLLGAWLLRSGRVTAGTIFVGLLCLFEVVSFPGWTRRGVLDWV
jgi:hypothetical protein